VSAEHNSYLPNDGEKDIIRALFAVAEPGPALTGLDIKVRWICQESRGKGYRAMRCKLFPVDGQFYADQEIRLDSLPNNALANFPLGLDASILIEVYGMESVSQGGGYPIWFREQYSINHSKWRNTFTYARAEARRRLSEWDDPPETIGSVADTQLQVKSSLRLGIRRHR
jgi:hypothetical protein